MGFAKSLKKGLKSVTKPVKSLLGGSGSSGGGGFGSIGVSAASQDPKLKNALQEGQARVAPVEAPKLEAMKKGGRVKKGYHKMPDGRIMKDSAHKKAKKSTASRGDGICRKGKTRGRMC